MAWGCGDDPVTPDPGKPIEPPPVAILYWASATDGSIWISGKDGQDPAAIVSESLEAPVGLAVDPVEGKVYWNDQGTKKIQRSSLDGSTVEDLPITVDLVRGMAVDAIHRKLYWVDDGVNANRIQRSNLDGTTVEDVYVYPSNVDIRMIAVDPYHAKIYWTGEKQIWRANLDGSGARPIVQGLQSQSGIGVEPVEGKVYWADYVAHKIQRANLDGSNVEDLVDTGLLSPWALAIDSVDRVIYWSDSERNVIQRLILDSGEVETVLSGLADGLRSLALGP